jgi:hypothetical protein
MKKNSDDNRIPFGPTPRDVEEELRRIERENNSKGYDDDLRFDLGDIPPVIIEQPEIIFPPNMYEWNGLFYREEDIPGGELVANRWCITVIDENRNSQSDAQVRQEYLDFRAAWPNRPMFILAVPESNGNSALRLPLEWGQNPLDFGPIPVNRDNGNPALASDWFDLIGLQFLQPGGKIALFIDTSGSMNLSTVAASFNLFTQRITEELPWLNQSTDIFTVGNTSERIWFSFIGLAD